MSKEIIDISDQESEKYILASIIRNGIDSYYECNTYITGNDFYYPENHIIYLAISQLIEQENIKNLDIPLISQRIRNLDIGSYDKYQIGEYLLLLSQIETVTDNLIVYAKNIARASLVRNLYSRLEYAQDNLTKISFEKPILDIVSETEKIIFDFNNKLLSNEEKTCNIGESIESFFEFLSKNRRSRLGIATGFPILDSAIGGGIRAPGVAVIGARSGVGKTTLAANIAINVSKQKIKTLYLDTEMTQELMQSKLLSITSDVKIFEVEAGGFDTQADKKAQIQRGVDVIKDLPLHYHNVSGLGHQQIISIARKWLHKEVGFDENGNLYPCLIILDYIKTMDTGQLKHIQEYQYLGQYLTDMHNFAVEYNIPILAMVQLNRDGIDKTDSGVVSGSDRILWLCTSLSFLKNKTEEDFVSDPIIFGDRKLIVNKSRFGPGLQSNEYINVICDLSKCKMSEGKTNLSNKSQSTLTSQNNSSNNYNTNKNSTRIVNNNNNDNDVIPF